MNRRVTRSHWNPGACLLALSGPAAPRSDPHVYDAALNGGASSPACTFRDSSRQELEIPSRFPRFFLERIGPQKTTRQRVIGEKKMAQVKSRNQEIPAVLQHDTATAQWALRPGRLDLSVHACCRIWLVMLAAAGSFVSGSAPAQSCQAPGALYAGALVQVDTCQSTYSPQFVCGSVAPSGPTVAFSLLSAYPSSSYTLSVTPATGAFDPVLIVQTPQCGASGNCPFVIDNAGAGASEMLNLGKLDRAGQYYVLVTSVDADAPCGQATIAVGYEAGGSDDGIFRSGVEY